VVLYGYLQRVSALRQLAPMRFVSVAYGGFSEKCRSVSGVFMKFEKGKSGNPNGKPKGIPNKCTTEFRQAVTNLLTYAAPEMIGWLKSVASTNPDKALNHVSKLAEYANPKLARTEHIGDNGVPIVHIGDNGAPIVHIVKWGD